MSQIAANQSAEGGLLTVQQPTSKHLRGVSHTRFVIAAELSGEIEMPNVVNGFFKSRRNPQLLRTDCKADFAFSVAANSTCSNV